jgi:hypothetical protein
MEVQTCNASRGLSCASIGVKSKPIRMLNTCFVDGSPVCFSCLAPVVCFLLHL